MKEKEVYVLTNTTRNSGRRLLHGILRFSMTRYDWRLRIMEPTASGRSKIARAALSRAADGIITSVLEHPALYRALEKSDVPLVAIGTRRDPLPGRSRNFAAVMFDECRFGREAGLHLFRLGMFRSFGFVHSRLEFLRHLSSLRAKGFLEELASHGVKVVEYVPVCPASADASALAAWVAGLEKPAAILAATDSRATEVYAACDAADAAIPDDVRVLGIDDDEQTCLSLKPPLSSLATDFEQQAIFAAETLERMMSQPKAGFGRRELVFPGGSVPVERSSTKVLAPGLELVRRACEYIERNADRRITVDDVASFLRVSKRTAFLRFAEFSDTSISQTIAAARIAYVKGRLRTSRQSILSISRMAGFDSPNHLKALFRKHTGMTMRDWRKTNA
ncbi:MAG: substrate-binding domain-containing protein [Kiritimatiellae bacterium]|nr:substrate-binding domain-containing protein [Kiritimatiellia bacterium]